MLKCVKLFGPDRLQICQAKDKIYAKCAKRGHFTKLCRSSDVNVLHRDNKEQPTTEGDVTKQAEKNDLLAFADFTSNNGYEKLQKDYFFIMEIY